MTSRNHATLAAKLALFVTVLLLAVPTAAFAQGSDPTAAQYDPTDQQVSGNVGSGSGGSGGSGGSTGSGLNADVAGLPFTGIDLMIVAGAGAALLGTGLVLRRLSSPAQTRS